MKDRQSKTESPAAVSSTPLVRQCRLVLHDDGNPLGSYWAAKDVATGSIIARSFGKHLAQAMADGKGYVCLPNDEHQWWEPVATDAPIGTELTGWLPSTACWGWALLVS